MKKIATHDSATGERGQGIISWLVTPFAKTQGKTIKEQYDAGCRMFDIRVKLVGGQWKCAHGLWHTQRDAYSILHEIDGFADKCHVSLTYEGGKKYVNVFSQFVDTCKANHKHIVWGGIAVKYGDGSHLFNVKFEYLVPYPKGWPKTEQAFLPLDGKTWHILLPIPWLWKKIYHNKVEFNEEAYRFVDFL